MKLKITITRGKHELVGTCDKCTYVSVGKFVAIFNLNIISNNGFDISDKYENGKAIITEIDMVDGEALQIEYI